MAICDTGAPKSADAPAAGNHQVRLRHTSSEDADQVPPLLRVGQGFGEFVADRARKRCRSGSESGVLGARLDRPSVALLEPRRDLHGLGHVPKPHDAALDLGFRVRRLERREPSAEVLHDRLVVRAIATASIDQRR